MTHMDPTAALTVTVPGLRLQSVANLREHWAKKHRRNVAEAFQVYASLIVTPEATRDALRKPGPLRVTLTRIYAGRCREFDDDNLRGAFKATRDQLAHWLARDDGRRGGITWEYKQERGGEHAVRIEITPVSASLADAG